MDNYLKNITDLETQVRQFVENPLRDKLLKNLSDIRDVLAKKAGHDRVIEPGMFSTRTFNTLKHARINSLSELASIKPRNLMKYRGFGGKAVEEIQQVLKANGIEWHVDPKLLRN